MVIFLCYIHLFVSNSGCSYFFSPDVQSVPTKIQNYYQNKKNDLYKYQVEGNWNL